MNFFRTLLVGAAIIGAAAPAIANTRAYNVGAHSTREIEITASDDFYLKVAGGENTDLDFRLISPTGKVVWEDTDGTSWTEANINVSRGGVYRLYIQNVGDDSNAATLTLQ